MEIDDARQREISNLSQPKLLWRITHVTIASMSSVTYSQSQCHVPLFVLVQQKQAGRVVIWAEEIKSRVSMAS